MKVRGSIGCPEHLYCTSCLTGRDAVRGRAQMHQLEPDESRTESQSELTHSTSILF